MDGSKLVDMETRLARVRVALVIGSVAMLVATTALYAWLKMEPFDGRLELRRIGAIFCPSVV